MLLDDLPLDWAAEKRLQMGILVRFPLVRPVQAQFAQILQTRQEFEAAPMAAGQTEFHSDKLPAGTVCLGNKSTGVSSWYTS